MTAGYDAVAELCAQERNGIVVTAVCQQNRLAAYLPD